MVTGRAFSCTRSAAAPVTSPQSPAPYQLDRIDQRNLPVDGSYSFRYTGAGVNV